jgi:hypothetical protein
VKELAAAHASPAQKPAFGAWCFNNLTNNLTVVGV